MEKTFRIREYIIICIFIIIALLPFRSIFNLFIGSIESDFIEIFAEPVYFYTLLTSIAIGCFFLFNWIYSRKSIVEFEKSEERKRVSDDIFIVFYLLAFIFYALPISFLDVFDSVYQMYEFYLSYTILSLAYIILLNITHVVNSINNHEKRIVIFNIGTRKEYTEIFLLSIISIIIFLVIFYFIPVYDSLLTEEGRELTAFMAFVSVPVEEIVFRGLLLDILIVIIIELFCDIKKIPRANRNSDNKEYSRVHEYAWNIGIVLSSYLFALFHLNHYGYNVFIMIYLMILAIIMGFARKLGGLTSSYVIHLTNNILANGLTAIIPILLIHQI